MFYRMIDDHLALRLFTPHDAEEAYALIDADREHLREYLNWVDAITSAEEERQSLATFGAFNPERAINCFLTLDGAIIGAAGVIIINHPAQWAEIGYWIGSGHEGRGYVTAAVRELERLSFIDLGLERVQIRVDVDNVRSRAVPERLGYTLEGVLRRTDISGSGRIADFCMYSLLKPEWQAR